MVPSWGGTGDFWGVDGDGVGFGMVSRMVTSGVSVGVDGSDASTWKS